MLPPPKLSQLRYIEKPEEIMQPVNRKVRDLLRADLWATQAQRLMLSVRTTTHGVLGEQFQLRTLFDLASENIADLAGRIGLRGVDGRKALSGFLAIVILLSAVAVGALPMPTVASSTNVLTNGGFESGFSSQANGAVGNGWNSFTNGGAVKVSFWDDTWAPTLADGAHSQGIGFSTVGIEENEQDRFAGIYQTVRLVDWAQYTLNMQGLLRSTRLDGDPYRYVVQVGWTWGPQPNWNAVTNWQDTNWWDFQDRENPGAMSPFSTNFQAEQGYATIYVRLWKKWWAPEEEVNLNLDAITLTGPAPMYSGGVAGQVTPNTGGPVAGYDPNLNNVPAANQGATGSQSAACVAGEMIYNGGFELGFNPIALGNVGRGWGYFSNGGNANFGFHNDQWPAVVAEGRSSQLLSIDTRNRWPADGDRVAGIYQQVGGLVANNTYQLDMRGILRGEGGDTSDQWRFVAEWGYTTNGSTDWTQVNNWETLTFGDIQSRTAPGAIGSFSRQFTAPSSSIVLFVRALSKWPVPDQEYNLNIDAISLRGCGGTGGPVTPPPSGCVYVVRPGDTLSKIAASAGTTVQVLMQINNITNPNIIFVGQHINLPNCGTPPPQPTPPPAAGGTCVVQPGDTLSAIAKRFGTTVAVLQHLNGIANPNLIFVGQILKLP